MLFVNHAVLQLGELSAVPAAGSTYKVSCDTLKLVDMLSTAMRALLKTLFCILESTVHAAVTVVVH